ncbi:MAG: serine protease inhibitor [halophilic archaeon J07HX5]|nr:MAG: serine protease inhibitor [halophilic archaeon J07HX5]
MERRQLLAVSGALLAGAVAGCTESSRLEKPGKPKQAPATTLASLDNAALETLVAQTNGFTIDLHRQLLADRSDENVFSSPISASMAFAMTYAGARGETRQQLREAFRYPEESLHATMGKLQSRLNQRGRETNETTSTDSTDDTSEEETTDSVEQPESDGTAFQLSIANAVWGQERFSFKRSYRDTLTEAYGSTLREAAFVENAADERERINDWVADETDDTIGELLPQGALGSRTRLVLVNAIYFLANWTHTFPEDATTDKTFSALDGTDHDVPMMSLKREGLHRTRRRASDRVALRRRRHSHDRRAAPSRRVRGLRTTARRPTARRTDRRARATIGHCPAPTV